MPSPGGLRRFRPLGERRERIAAHHRRRSAEVAAALDAMPTPTVWQVAARLRWSGGRDAMRDYRLASAPSQTVQHVDLLDRVGELADDGPGKREEWRPKPAHPVMVASTTV